MAEKIILELKRNKQLGKMWQTFVKKAKNITSKNFSGA